ncbi:glycosyl transferase [Siccirubricoccus deserti]|uniref:Glycosyltransferase family 4 protein n=1 Tax=Siccirubricoccus deserti TaxID=2013562 RepID=A0A9X0R397_9PROT|nr:glycosyltransferase family 4 protein [Siccirubricoccus deserti]MBC4018830.1 glycosyltransferase family 4 protein [Siccirubricoccus deserti]GGC68585.1 glycosyl transferase [Siccirubricoccus deserti]
MRIAQIAPLAEAVPPLLYGGTERIVSYLTEELVALGHDVTLFASGDSRTAARLEAITPRALRLDASIRDTVAPHILMLSRLQERLRDFDVVHFHIDHLHLPMMRGSGLPFLTTLHGRLDLPEIAPLFQAHPEAPFVSISNAQRRPLPSANWAGTVLHGLPTDLLPFSPRDRGYLAFLGRISPEKGPDVTIRIARAAGIPPRIAAKVDNMDRAYFETAVRPLLDGPGVEFIGEVDEAQKAEFLGGARALLFPIQWPEPFGLVMIEAMACGTPVVAFNRGSVPEVMEDGMTGFVVEDETGALGALRRIGSIDRTAVRRVFERRFTARRMAEDYLALYRRLGAAHERPVLRVA